MREGRSYGGQGYSEDNSAGIPEGEDRKGIPSPCATTIAATNPCPINSCSTNICSR